MGTGIQQAVRDSASQTSGLLDRATALALGLNDTMIRAALTAGAWTAPHPGVYQINVTPMNWKDRCMAAVLAAGPGAAVSHRSAMRFWGLDGIKTSAVEVTVHHGNGPIPDGVTVHRTRRPIPMSSIDSVPVTTVERTILDVSWMLPRRIVETAMFSAIYKELTTFDMLWEGLIRHGGRGVAGTRKFRSILTEIDLTNLPQSPAEVDMKNLIDQARVPRPSMQHEIRRPGGIKAFADFAWPRRTKIVEVDSMLAHSTPDQLDHDLDRQNDLLALGWEIRRFTARRIRDDPSGVIDELELFVGPP